MSIVLAIVLIGAALVIGAILGGLVIGIFAERNLVREYQAGWDDRGRHDRVRASK